MSGNAPGPITDAQTRRPAGLARRLAAIVYDAIVLFGVLFVASVLVVPLAGEAVGPDHPLQPIYQLYLLAVIALYFTGFWTHGGQTIGMRTWRIRLERVDGGPVDVKRALLRFFAALLSGLALGIGFAWGLVDRERRTWHDRWSGTRLVRVPRPARAVT